jgi:flagellar biosynthetic protein FliP
VKKLISILLFLFSGITFAQQGNVGLPGLSVNFGQGTDLVDTIQVLVLFTVLTMAPAILILCTCFTRIIVVLSFMRQAIGTQNLPPNQLLIGFALFLSIFVMKPTGMAIYNQGIQPYVKKQIKTEQALTVIEYHLRGFMSKQVRKADIGLFFDITGEKAPNDINEVPIHYLIPAFIISELKTAFQILSWIWSWPQC